MAAKQPKVIVLRTAGTNCDQETAFAFKSFGAKVDCVHINQLINKRVKLNDYHILAIPGGFTYGDDIESGRVLANELCLFLGLELNQFIADGKIVIGICNGFQVLVKAGILPGPLTEVEELAQDHSQKMTLTHNDSGKFEARWTYLKVNNKSVWTKDMEDVVYIPVAHAEGKFLVKDNNALNQLESNGQVAFRYSTRTGARPTYPMNPNGSSEDIAGITDTTGRILGMMPHPERHFLFHHHPRWTRKKNRTKFGEGAKIFENGVTYVKKNF